jgi:hypothetical protein
MIVSITRAKLYFYQRYYWFHICGKLYFGHNNLFSHTFAKSCFVDGNCCFAYVLSCMTPRLSCISPL